MIRPTTVLCLLAACGSGLYLYSEKHRTTLLDRDIGRVIHATEAAQARTGMLRAEWALLNEPGRLQDMAGRYLALHPMAPTQFVQLASLAAHLPAPAATPPGGFTDDEAPADDATAAAAGPAGPAHPDAAVAASLDPAALPASQAEIASHPTPAARADAKPAPKLLASVSPRPRAPHHVALADRQTDAMHGGLLPHGMPLPLAAPQPMGASVYSAMARPMRPMPGRPAVVAAVPSYVQSALGGGMALPPPVPYGR